MIEKSWDPLAAGLSEEMVGATIKRQIKNILKSYTGWYDPFSELVQNALDAIDKRLEHNPAFHPKIFVRIDLRENLIAVTDNGIGFSEAQLQNFLAPNVSFKDQSTRGNKGVGATYLGYGFNFLQVGTKTPGFTFVGTLQNGRTWVEDSAGIVPRPVVTPDGNAIHAAFAAIDQGSTFCLRLVGDNIRPKNLTWTQATTVKQWEPILRLKTPLGGIYLGQHAPHVQCELEVIDEAGVATNAQIAPCEYLYPHSVISACQSIDTFRQKQIELIKQGKDASKFPDNMLGLNGMYNIWGPKEFTDPEGEFGKAFSAEELALIKVHDVRVYGFMCYSNDIWDTYNDEILKLRKSGRLLRGGLQLATNGMPQGEQIVIPLKRYTGYQHVTHVVIHLSGADPDLGRKGFQPELQKLCERISVVIVDTFLVWKRHLKRDTGAPPDIVAQKDIHEWIIAQEQHEKASPLVITRKDVFLPMLEPSLTSLPLNEQDVIALFNQLLAGGVIRGIKVMATSGHNQYDGVFRYVLREPIVNFVFDKAKNPLGLDKNATTKQFESAPMILEYKYKLDSLIEDFEKGEKNEKDIALAVVWDVNDEWKARYSVTPLLLLENLHHRSIHGVTHIVKSIATGERTFNLVALRELIEYINDPDAVQKYQKETYA